MKPYFERLFDYNRWAFQKLEEHLNESDLENQEVTKLLSHCFNAEKIWLNRIEGVKENFAVWALHPSSQVFSLLKQSNLAWQEFIEDVDDFEKVVKYCNSKGTIFHSKLSDIVTHVANHATHHRGQIATLIRQSGSVPPPLDFIFFTRH